MRNVRKSAVVVGALVLSMLSALASAAPRTQYPHPLRFTNVGVSGKPGVEAIIGSTDVIEWENGALVGRAKAVDENATNVRLVKSDGAEIGRGSVLPDGGFLITPDEPVNDGDRVRLEWWTGREIVDVEAGMGFFVALASDGSVWTWGKNDAGQLGVGGKSERTEPTQVVEAAAGQAPLPKFVQIQAHPRSVTALAEDGTVWAWGNNTGGEIGRPGSSSYDKPVQIPGLNNIVAIHGAESSNFAVDEQGNIWAWGRNGSEKRLGVDGDSVIDAPTQVLQGHRFKELIPGTGGTIGIADDGSAWLWGNFWGGLGSVPQPTKIEQATEVDAEMSTIVQSAIAYNSPYFLLDDNGVVWAFGQGVNGALGNGSLGNSAKPIKVPGLPRITQVAGHFQGGIVLAEDGTVWVWGDNGAGQLGDGTQDHSRTAKKVEGLPKIVEIDANSYTVVARAEDGSIWWWGEGNGVMQTTPVSVQNTWD